MKPWKTRREVKGISFSSRTLLGKSGFGSVFDGHINFKDNSRQRIAVKKFHKPLSAEQVNAYERTIQDLREAGIPLPKMGFIEKNGEWIQAMQLFTEKRGKETKSKLFPLHEITKHPERKKLVKELLELTAKTVNAGYPPAFDLFNLIKTEKGFGVIPFDLDNIINFKGNQEVIQGRLRVMIGNLELSKQEIDFLASRIKDKKIQEYALQQWGLLK